jgi:hypothetical protein
MPSRKPSTTGKTTTTNKRGNAITANGRPGAATSKTSARSTAGGPAHADAAAAGDAAFVRMQATQALAAKMLFNANKPHEHGKLARTPVAGVANAPADPSVRR